MAAHLAVYLCFFASSCFFSLQMERLAKLRKLDDARRKLPFASVSACSAWMNEIRKDLSLLDAPLHRKAFQEARDNLVLHSKTAFGPILQTIKMIKTDGEYVDLYVAHPWATLDVCISKSDRFKHHFMKQLRAIPCTLEDPWHLIVYSDEVTPGNVHSPQNNRKFWAVYWSFLELGPAALAHEEFWIPLMAEFSAVVKECSAGLSQVFAGLAKLFFEPHGFNAAPAAGGVLLPSIGVRFFVALAIVLQDGGAHKAVWHSRDGSKMCILCKNLFTVKSEIADADGTELLTCGVCKLADLEPETSESLRNKARWLEHNRHKPDFDDLQQALGITYHPHMFLLDRYLDKYVDVAAVFMHDYMHAFWVDGVFNVMLYLLFEAFVQERRPVYKAFSGYLDQWSWPGKNNAKASELAKIFSTERTKSNRKAKHIKCSASECWNLLAPLTAFLHEVLLTFDSCKAECEVFLALLKIIELVSATSRRKVEPATLLVAAEDFLAKFATTFGVEMTTPKFHWLLHFPEYLQRMHELFERKLGYGWLQNCFVLERKHKVGKQYAEPRKHTNKMKSGGLLSEILCQTMYDLSAAPALDGLVGGKAPSKAVRMRILKTLELDNSTEVLVARRSYHSPVSHSEQNDFVVFTCFLTGEMRAGFVQFHALVGGLQLSVITLYKLVSRNNNYVVWGSDDGSTEWTETERIIDPVSFKRLPNGNVAFYLPPEMR
jgi:hypothetical protein